MKRLSIILFLLVVLINACKEENSDEIDYNPNVLSSRDYIRGEDAIFEVVNAFFKGVNDSNVVDNGYGYIDNCDVTYRPAENALQFGYGIQDRLCQDDKYRRGSFTAAFSGEIFLEGVNAHITTDSLFVDFFYMEVTMDIENLGLNNGKPEFSLKVTSSNIMLPDTTEVNGVVISTDFIMTWEEGASTPTIHEDDLYLITGTASGTSSDLYEFSVAVLEPLENWLDCYWIARGINEMTVPSGQFTTGTIDYISDDGCDNEFYFYFNNSTFYDIIK